MGEMREVWRSETFLLRRSWHPPEHGDGPFHAVSQGFMATFVERGDFILTTGGVKERLVEGDAFLRHPGMAFHAGFDGTGFNDTCLTLVYLGPTDLPPRPAATWPGVQRPVLRASNQLRYLHWSMTRAALNRDTMLAEECAAAIVRVPALPSGRAYRTQTFRAHAARIDAARERIDRDYHEDLSLTALARSSGLGLHEFARVFASMTGRPPHRYLADVRFTRAAEFLVQGMSVTDTCYACGFGNLSHFIRRFRARFGVAPSQYSGQLRKKAQAG